MWSSWKMSLAAVATLVLLALASGRAAAQTQLTYRAQAGDQLRYEITQQIAVQFKSGKKQDFKEEDKFNVVWSVQAIDAAGKATVKFKTTRFDEKPAGAEKLSREDKELMQAMADWFTVTIDKYGQMTDLKMPTPLEKLLKAEFKHWEKMVPLQTLMQQQLDLVKNAANPVNLVFPAEPVAKDGSWKAKIVTPSFYNLPAVQHNTFSLQEPVKQGGKSLEKILIKTAAELDKTLGGKVDPKDFPLKVNWSSKGDGFVLFDNTAGRIEEARLVTQVDMEVAGAAKAPSRIVYTTTMKLLTGK